MDAESGDDDAESGDDDKGEVLTSEYYKKLFLFWKVCGRLNFMAVMRCLLHVSKVEAYMSELFLIIGKECCMIDVVMLSTLFVSFECCCVMMHMWGG